MQNEMKKKYEIIGWNSSVEIYTKMTPKMGISLYFSTWLTTNIYVYVLLNIIFLYNPQIVTLFCIFLAK